MQSGPQLQAVEIEFQAERGVAPRIAAFEQVFEFGDVEQSALHPDIPALAGVAARHRDIGAAAIFQPVQLETFQRAAGR